jgi:hypothetical protein
MAENLLKWLPVLTKEDCNEIVFAVSTFGPSRYRTNPPRYNATASDLGLLNREDVIAALREVYRVYGTAGALATLRTLESER